jgi:hypothetical protein
MKDYYAILGIRPTAHAAEIKRVYRRLVVQYHPDKNPDPQAHAYMAEINEAYDVLGDPASRATYDQRMQRGWAGGLTETPEQTPPPPRHRDPKYRPRPAPTMSARRQRQELMKKCVPVIRWFNVVGLTITILFGLDYIIPPARLESNVANFYLHRPTNTTGRYRNMNTVLYLFLENGDELKIYDYDRQPVRNVPVRYTRTWIYRTYMGMDYQDQYYRLAYVYGPMALFPMVVFGTSLAAVVRRRDVEFFFNASIVVAILLIVTLWLIL